MHLITSIKDARTTVNEMRVVIDKLDGIVNDDILDNIIKGVDEIDDYLIPDAEEARVRINELEDELGG